MCVGQSKSTRLRPKLKILVRYKVFHSIRFFRFEKPVKQKRSAKQTSIKQRLSSLQRQRGWKLMRPKIVRNDIFVIPKLPVVLTKRYKSLLVEKQRFKLSVFIKNVLLKKFFRSTKKWSVLIGVWLRVDFIIFRIFPVSSLFFVRQLIKHGFVLVGSKPVNHGGHLVKVGDIIVITKRLVLPQVCLTHKRFFIPSPMFFDFDVNYQTQSFVLNSPFLHSYARFSNFPGFGFQYENVKNFYNR